MKLVYCVPCGTKALSYLDDSAKATGPFPHGAGHQAKVLDVGNDPADQIKKGETPQAWLDRLTAKYKAQFV